MKRFLANLFVSFSVVVIGIMSAAVVIVSTHYAPAGWEPVVVIVEVILISAVLGTVMGD